MFFVRVDTRGLPQDSPKKGSKQRERGIGGIGFEELLLVWAGGLALRATVSGREDVPI